MLWLGGVAAAPVELPAHELTPEQPSENPREKPRPCDQIYVSEYWLLDATRERLEESFCAAALWLDGVAGQRGSVLAARRSRGQLELSHYYSEFSGHKPRLRLKLRTELPVLRKRLSAFIGLDSDDRFIQGRNESFALRSEFPNLDNDDEWLAGLGYSFPGSRVFRSDFRVGARRFANTMVFVQNRFRYLAYSDQRHVLTLRDTVFWTNEDGFGNTFGTDLMRVLSQRMLLRWDSVGTVSEASLGLDWRSALLLYQELRSDRAIAYEVFSRGETDHPVPVREYGLRTLLRQPWFGKRLFVEYVVGYTWPQIDPLMERDGSFGMGISFEMPFGPEEKH